MANLDLRSVYKAWSGHEPTEEQIRELESIAARVRIDPGDSFWSVVVALQYHKDLYKQFPAEIADAARAIIEDFRHAAGAQAEAASAQAQADLAAAVSTVAQDVAKQVSKKSMYRWAAAAAGVITVALLAVGIAGYTAGHDAGEARGYAAARNEAAAASWGATPEGLAAYEMHRNGALGMLQNCAGGGWKKSDDGDFCYPFAEQRDGQSYTVGWRLPGVIK